MRLIPNKDDVQWTSLVFVSLIFIFLVRSFFQKYKLSDCILADLTCISVLRLKKDTQEYKRRKEKIHLSYTSMIHLSTFLETL